MTEHEAIIFQYDHRERTADFADNAEIGLRPDRAEKVEQENSRAHSAGTKRVEVAETGKLLRSIIYYLFPRLKYREVGDFKFTI